MKLCACGCGLPVKRPGKTWLGGHVPRELRAKGGTIGRRNYAYKRRRIAFDRHLADLRRDGRTITTETLLTVFAQIDRVAYHRGYKSAETKFTGRKWWKKPQAA